MKKIEKPVSEKGKVMSVTALDTKVSTQVSGTSPLNATLKHHRSSSTHQYSTTSERLEHSTGPEQGVEEMPNRCIAIDTARRASLSTISSQTNTFETREQREFFRYEGGELIEYDLTRCSGKHISLQIEEREALRRGSWK